MAATGLVPNHGLAPRTARTYPNGEPSTCIGLPIVVDKLPHNFLHLGLAAILTPQARVIHCVRDPVDTCLSCYFQHFAGPANAFASRLDALSSFYGQYHRLMKHWASVLPLEVMTVRYEDVVADRSRRASKCSRSGALMGSCSTGLHKSARVCATASYAQVSNPSIRRVWVGLSAIATAWAS